MLLPIPLLHPLRSLVCTATLADEDRHQHFRSTRRPQHLMGRSSGRLQDVRPDGGGGVTQGPTGKRQVAELGARAFGSSVMSQIQCPRR